MNEASSPLPIGIRPPVPTITGPRSFGEILDRTFQLMRNNFRTLVGITSVPIGACLAVYVIVLGVAALSGFFEQAAQNQHPERVFLLIFPLMLIVGIPLLAVFAVYVAAGCYASAQADLGIKTSFRKAYALAWRNMGRYFGLLLWMYLRAFFLPLAIMMLMFAIGAVSVFAPGAKPGPGAFLVFPLGMLLYFAAYVYGFIVLLRLSLAFPACVMEGLTARAALKRSSLLTKGAKGRIFLMMLVIHVIGYVFFLSVYFVALILALVGALAGSMTHIAPSPPWSYIGIGLLGICVAAVIFFWLTITWGGATTSLAVLYHDQRVRKEGYDIERLMQRAGLEPPSGATLESPRTEEPA